LARNLPLASVKLGENLEDINNFAEVQIISNIGTWLIHGFPVMHLKVLQISKQIIAFNLHAFL
jgi:hypothetical protein